METFFFYILRASAATAILYLCYKLFISKTTFHNMNRIVLLVIFASTLLLPFISIQLPEINWFQRQGNHVSDYWQLLQEASETEATLNTTPESTFPWINVLLIFYPLGLLFCMLRYAVGFLRMSQLVRNSKKTKLADGTEIYISSKNIAPFSWMNIIVIGAKDFSDENRDIISHEKSHVDRKHSIDLLFVDVYCTLFWFNPFAWLLRHELRNTHEYQADLDVTTDKSDLKSYQLLLIRHCVGEHKFSIASNFELNNLQKRIQMIMRTKSSNKSKWLYSSLISGVLVTLLVLSTDSLQAKNESEQAVVIETRAPQKEENAKKSTAQPKEEKSVEIKIRGINKTDKDTGEELQTQTKGNIKKIVVNVDSLSGDEKSKDAKKVLIFLDNKEISEEDLNKIDADKIDNVRVYKGKDADEHYTTHGKKAKDGVVYVTTKNDKSVNVRLTDSEKQPLYIVDGKEIAPEKINSIIPDEIESISVLKDKSATSVYGEKGKNGVILITSKKAKEEEKE